MKMSRAWLMPILVVLLFMTAGKVPVFANDKGFLRAYGNGENNYLLWSKYSSHHDCFFLFGFTDDVPYLNKVDRNGNILWTRYYEQGFSPADVDELPVIGQEDPDIIVCMSKYGTYRDIHVMRIKAETGEVVWSYEFLPQSSVRFPHLIISSDNKIIISGINIGNAGMVFAKLDLDGNILWARRYTSSTGSTFASGGNMIRDYNGGALTSFQMGTESGLFAVDANGNLRTLRQANIFHIFRDVALAKDGYLIATIKDWDQRGRDHGVVKLDLNFNVSWARSVNPPMATPSTCSSCGLPSVGEAPSGDIFYVQDSYLPGYLAFSVLKFNKDGNLLRARSFQKSDVSLQALRSVSGTDLSIVGATTRVGLCLPGGAQNGLFGVFSEDLDICEVIDIAPVVQNVPLSFTLLPAGTLNILNHPLRRNVASSKSTVMNFAQTQFCENEKDFINLGPDLLICSDSSINLSPGSGYSNYSWSTGEETSSVSVNIPGLYSVVVTTVCGTQLTDSIRVSSRAVLVNNVVQICAGETYSIGNSQYTIGGMYIDTLTNFFGCDSIITTNLTVITNITSKLDTTICAGERFMFGSNYYNASGTYVEVFRAQGGCDSTVTLNLLVRPQIDTMMVVNLCEGERFEANQQIYDTTGVFAIILPSFSGCDSTVYLDVRVFSLPSRDLAEQICQGQSFSIGSQQFTETGQYVVRFSNATGCDSTIVLNLEVVEPEEILLTPSICQGESYSAAGQVYTSPGNYLLNLTGTNGCDSLVSIQLTVLTPDELRQEVTICSGQTYSVGANVYDQAGTYVDVLTNAFGCDSVVTTLLSIVPSFQLMEEKAICYGEQLIWNQLSLNEAGIYKVALQTVFGCDSTISLLLSVHDTPDLRADASPEFIFKGSPVVLSTTPANASLEYAWSPMELISSPNQATTNAFPDQNTWFRVTAIDIETDCSSTDSVFVKVFDDCSVSIPTAFSPNGDGINDCFRVLGSPKQENFRLSIYNRWSELVFDSNERTTCWDGTFKNNQAPMDTYVVHISYTCSEEQQVEKSGMLLLMR
jgi:gliding motility-associated-like protein